MPAAQIYVGTVTALMIAFGIATAGYAVAGTSETATGAQQ